jgi:adenylosuccinate synthase
MSKASIVVGLQAGDEAKGRITDYLMKDAEICVRYSGSCNTGATVLDDKGNKFKFHHLPVSIARNKPSYIGSSCLLDPNKLLQEINHYKSLGFDVDANLRISPDCHIITEEHIRKDNENENAGSGVGSTRRGVAYCAADKYARTGQRIESLGEFGKYFADVPSELNKAIDDNKSVIFEGSQGFALDIDQGNYPFVSSTSNVAGAACSSCGVGPTRITNVIGVAKCYSTYVGTGPYINEIRNQDLNEKIAQIGGEFGTTTGRRRRVGFLDLVTLKKACLVNGCTEIALTKSDVLVGMQMKYCMAYLLDGKFIYDVPASKKDYWRCSPVYKQIYVETGKEFIPIVEKATGLPVKYFTYGPNYHDIEEL